MREKQPVTLKGRGAIASRIVLAVLLVCATLPPAAGAQETTSDELWDGEALWDGTVNPSTQHGSHEVIVVPRDAATCGLPFTFTYTTFEPGEHLTHIHPAEGFIIPGSNIEFNANWLTFTNPPATFTGNPSGQAVALWVSGPFGEVNFQEPVSGVSLFYASVLTVPVTLEAYDATGNLVGSPSQGSATGGFRAWARLKVIAGRRVITRARLFARVPRRVLVDDLGTCGGPLEVDIDIKPGSDPNSINLGAAGVVPVAILSSDTFDATTVDPDTVSLAGAAVKMMGKSNRFMCHQEDVNTDGRLDLICQVENLTQFLMDTGQTIAVLEATTFDGQPIRGEDTVNIVPDQ